MKEAFFHFLCDIKKVVRVTFNIIFQELFPLYVEPVRSELAKQSWLGQGHDFFVSIQMRIKQSWNFEFTPFDSRF
ncbi:hypothetical protein SAMN04487979_13437 [Flavobacterium sp. ov086]|nr:hypothetical protein SAMN04487979_13437 [Flavobacterium sp. ov086]